MTWCFLADNRVRLLRIGSFGYCVFYFFPTVDLHSVNRCFTVRATSHKVHSAGGWFFMRYRCVRRVWPILSPFIIISVFLEVLCRGQEFMLCFILFVVLVKPENLWYILCDYFYIFFVSYIVLYFYLVASDTIEYFAWSARSFPYILQCYIIVL